MAESFLDCARQAFSDEGRGSAPLAEVTSPTGCREMSAMEMTTSGPSRLSDEAHDVVQIAMQRRARLLREIIALDEFLRVAEMLLGHVRSGPRPVEVTAADEPSRRSAGVHRGNLLWAIPGTPAAVDRTRAQNRFCPARVSKAPAKASAYDSFYDTFIFHETPSA